MRPIILLLALTTAAAAQVAPAGKEGDYITKNFKFVSGESLPELRIHYTTLGTPRKDAQGIVRNAVLIGHGTGGTGRAFLSATFGGELFGPGKILDTARYFIVLPDGIGHGGSSKPSNGLHMKFPHYDYDDMVKAEYLLLTDGLKVNHLRLVMGTSMGCMHAWVWGYTYPNFADGLVPLACVPTQIAGRNRMIRTMIMDDITDSPDFNGGEYTTQPHGLRAAIGQLYIMSSAPLVQHKQAPTRDRADSVIRRYIDNAMKTTDANDMLYYFGASRNYDPSPHLAQVTAPVLAINSADDFVNPPELGIEEKLIAQVKHATFVMVPISDQTRGHGTHSVPAVWDSHLKDFLATLPER
ncbi:MAG TPA: alpha/beta fold hydrolase [Gemmatimonadaceae bacterium]|jgi:homoserine O-acetyltransferase|nr:alpha/beta fold hydrolase [Gemmatimonadaceae bacterium]